MIAIFSDLHLGLNDESKANQAFLKTLNSFVDSSIEQIWFLGDVYDLFIGPFKFWEKTHEQFFTVLKKLRDKNKRIIWVEGNHDFYLQNLLQPLGVEYKTEDFEENIYNIRVYAGHGDTVNSLDKKYLKWRKVIKSGAFRKVIRLNPNFLAERIFLPLACRASQESRARGKAHNREAAKEIYENFAKNLISNKNFQAVILGHDHHYTLKKFGAGFYLNLGHWTLTSGRYAQWNPGQLPKIIDLNF